MIKFVLEVAEGKSWSDKLLCISAVWAATLLGWMIIS